MSLLRLLAAGRCWVGTHDKPTRYKMRTESLLPNFGSAKSAFSSSAAIPTAKPAKPVTPARAFQAPVKKQSVGTLPVSHSKPATVESQLSKKQTEPVVKKSEPIKTAQVKVAATAESVAAVAGNIAKRATARSAGLLKKANPVSVFKWMQSQAQFSNRPRATRSPVQGELSLDKVKVIRNDLNDADIEIVAPRTETSPASPGPALPMAAARPSGLGRLASRFFGVEEAQIR